MVWACKYFRPYLYGKKFRLQTDHKPFIWLNNLKEESLFTIWKLALNEYTFDIDYIKGKENNVADFLSRLQVNALEEMGVDETQANVQSTSATIHSALEDMNDHIWIT